MQAPDVRLGCARVEVEQAVHAVARRVPLDPEVVVGRLAELALQLVREPKRRTWSRQTVNFLSNRARGDTRRTFQPGERRIAGRWRAHLELAQDAAERDSGIVGVQGRDGDGEPEAALQRALALDVPAGERGAQRRVVRVLELRAALAPQPRQHVLHQPAPRLRVRTLSGVGKVGARDVRVEPLPARVDLEPGVFARDTRFLCGHARHVVARGVGHAALARLAVPVLDPRPHVLAVDIVVPPEAVRAEPVDERALVLVQRVRGVDGGALQQCGLQLRPDAQKDLGRQRRECGRRGRGGGDGEGARRPEGDDLVQSVHLRAGVCETGMEEILRPEHECVSEIVVIVGVRHMGHGESKC